MNAHDFLCEKHLQNDTAEELEVFMMADETARAIHKLNRCTDIVTERILRKRKELLDACAMQDEINTLMRDIKENGLDGEKAKRVNEIVDRFGG